MVEELAARAATFVAAPAVLPPVMRDVSWHSFDLQSGRRGPRLVTSALGAVSRILSEATESTISVQIPADVSMFDDWQAATQPAAVMLVALADDETPVWGGLVYRRVSSADEWSTLNMVSLEAYLDRRYVNNDVTFTNADQVSEIAKQVIESTLADGVDFTVDAPYSNWRRDREYTVDDDKTILSVLQELAGVEDGIEFTVDLGWRDPDAKMVLDRIIRVRNRVGTAYLGSTGTESDQPIAVFHMPGSVTDFTYLEDYSPDNGANGVLAVSSGEGDTRPESIEWIPANTVFSYGGTLPLFEKRFTPSTSITDIGTLNNHALAELQQTWDGMIELTLEANLDTAPRLNADWFLGDDVAVSLTCRRFPERTNSDGEVVPGYQSNARCIGWEVDFDARSLKPRLLETTEIEVEAL